MNFLKGLPSEYQLPGDTIRQKSETQQEPIVQSLQEEKKTAEDLKIKILEAQVKALSLEKENLVTALKEANARYVKLRDAVSQSVEPLKDSTKIKSLEELLYEVRGNRLQAHTDMLSKSIKSSAKRRF